MKKLLPLILLVTLVTPLHAHESKPNAPMKVEQVTIDDICMFVATPVRIALHGIKAVFKTLEKVKKTK